MLHWAFGASCDGWKATSWGDFENPQRHATGQCSIGFQPVFCLTVERRISLELTVSDI